MIYKNREEGFMRLRGVSLVCWQNEYYLSTRRGANFTAQLCEKKIPSNLDLELLGFGRLKTVFELWYVFSYLDICHPPKKSLLQACCLQIGPRFDGLKVEDLDHFASRESCFFLQKDPHGWKFSFTVVFPTNRFFNGVMSMIWNVLCLKLYPSIRRMFLAV